MLLCVGPRYVGLSVWGLCEGHLYIKAIDEQHRLSADLCLGKICAVLLSPIPTNLTKPTSYPILLTPYSVLPTLSADGL